MEVLSGVAVPSHHALNYCNLLLSHEFIQGLSAYGTDCLFNPCSAFFFVIFFNLLCPKTAFSNQSGYITLVCEIALCFKIVLCV